MDVELSSEASVPTQAVPVIQLDDVHQVYGSGEGTVYALRGIDLTVGAGEYVSIMGPSGSGKSTLMNVLGCLDVPSHGRYLLAGTDVKSLTENALARVRNRELGFVFQSFNLVARMTAQQNVELPLVYGGVSRRERRDRATEALAEVGLADRADHRPHQLSGGQQQRVAIARALVTSPTLILADEPTGNLDSVSTAEILEILDNLALQGRTIVVITHEEHVAERSHRVLTIADGRIVSDHPVSDRAASNQALSAAGELS